MKLKNKKNIVIASLLFVVLLMGVAFAAFQTNLTINGSSNINSNWCVGFDSSKTNTYVATAGITGATAPTGQMAYSGNTCQTSYKTIATLTSKFTQPGDKVVYTLMIANKSSSSAQIDSITVDSQSVTSDTTITKGNIKYKVEMPASTTLASNAETTMKVTAEFQNDTNIGNYTTSESASIDVRINTSEGSNGSTPTNAFTGTIYRNNTNEVKNGDSIADTPIYEWCMVGTFQGQNFSSCDYEGGYFTSSSECERDLAFNIAEGYINEGDASCEQSGRIIQVQAAGIGSYTTNPSTLNANIYLKHDVVDDIITASYVCFIYNNAEHCMGATNDANSIAANFTILHDYQAFYNLQSCQFEDDDFGIIYCRGGEFSEVGFNDYGGAHVSFDQHGCEVEFNGDSRCY